LPLDADPRTLGLLALVLIVAMGAGIVGVRRVVPSGRSQGDESVAPLARGAIALVAATYFLLVFGSSVRVNGAGLACPDWPACFGQVVPQIDWEVGLEFGHRVWAGGVSVFFLALGALVLRRADLRGRMGKWFALAAVALAVQVVLGGLTVLHLLAEWTVASHLLGGNTFSLLLAVIALELREISHPIDRAPVSAAQRAASIAMAILVPAQLALGGLVAGSHAGLACGTWPGCNGPVWFPTFEGIVGLQVTHRIVAYTLLGAALFAFGASRGRGRTAGAVLVALVLAQATLGVANVLLHLPVEVTLLHSAGAAAIVLSTTWYVYEAWRAPLAVKAAAPATLTMAEAK
jgi:cytochrome c oxidase assembly protein subunit 15